MDIWLRIHKLRYWYIRKNMSLYDDINFSEENTVNPKENSVPHD